MCGIFGFLHHHSDSHPDRNLLNISAKKLTHRGPDHQSIFTNKGLGLVHTRLSLLDLSERSNQPFFSRNKSHCLVYNGEIYNFKEIREDLEKKGITFRTTSDTEVVLEAMLHYGYKEALKKFDGMFSFALYDFSTTTLTLARDRFGMKPLFYYEKDDQFIFASELSALIPWIQPEVNVPSIIFFLQGFGGPTKGPTFLKHVRISEPGEMITVRKGQKAIFETAITITDLYDKAYTQSLSTLTKKQIIDKADELLFSSVKKQLMADVPVGAFCSGGVDSSVVMAMASRLHNDLAIFHANVLGKCSELDAASLLAKHLKLELKYVDVTDDDFISLIPEIIQHYSHPYAYHPNSVPFYKVSQLVRQNQIKAVLSGEGSDECFIGYPWLIPNTKENFKKLFRHSLIFSVKQLIDQCRGKILAQERDSDADNIQDFLEVQLENINIQTLLSENNTKEFDKRDMITLNQLNYHLRTLLHRNDCVGMSSSIESRFPFLDLNVVKFAVNLPYQYKVRFSPSYRHDTHEFLVDKWILRSVASRYLPKSLAFRKKIGFPTNAQSRMKIPLEFFDNAAVSDLLNLSKKEFSNFYTHASHNVKMKLMQTEIWAQLFIHQVPIDSLKNKLIKKITF
ncbi:MAG: asparagine synthase (glutamine-hydrolyzing) [Candidatus Omnitrophica bacterium]|nr:asparagine synthase (glutamine-hydrolyzing) [Candidatus Omnitrophota bacterium]